MKEALQASFLELLENAAEAEMDIGSLEGSPERRKRRLELHSHLNKVKDIAKAYEQRYIHFIVDEIVLPSKFDCEYRPPFNFGSSAPELTLCPQFLDLLRRDYQRRHPPHA